MITKNPFEELSDEDKRELGQAFFNECISLKRHAATLSGDYGKWTIATIFATNAAITLAARDKINTLGDATLVASMFLFVLATGFFAWINWYLISEMYNASAQYEVIINIENYKTPKASGWIRGTYFLALLCAFVSVICAGLCIFCVLLEMPVSNDTIGR